MGICYDWVSIISNNGLLLFLSDSLVNFYLMSCIMVIIDFGTIFSLFDYSDPTAQSHHSSPLSLQHWFRNMEHQHGIFRFECLWYIVREILKWLIHIMIHDHIVLWVFLCFFKMTTKRCHLFIKAVRRYDSETIIT